MQGRIARKRSWKEQIVESAHLFMSVLCRIFWNNVPSFTQQSNTGPLYTAYLFACPPHSCEDFDVKGTHRFFETDRAIVIVRYTMSTFRINIGYTFQDIHSRINIETSRGLNDRNTIGLDS